MSVYRPCSEEKTPSTSPDPDASQATWINSRFGGVRCQREEPIGHGWFRITSFDDLGEHLNFEYMVKIDDKLKRHLFARRDDSTEYVAGVFVRYGDFCVRYSMPGERHLDFCLAFMFYGFVVLKNKRKTMLMPIADLNGNCPKELSGSSPMGRPKKVISDRPRTYTYLMKFDGYLQRFIDLKRVDVEFCPGELKPVTMDEPPADDVDELVYLRFKEIMNLKKNGGQGLSGRRSHKMHGIRWTELTKVYKGWSRTSDLSWEDIDGQFLYAVRPRALKKDGTVRKVFVMSPKLNAFITQVYGEQEPKFPDNIRIVPGVAWKPFKHSYDVRSCDRNILPYFRRLIRELYPEDEDKLLAPCIHENVLYPLPQFPSGVCVFMKYITSAFTVALLNLGNVPGTVQVQGDGVAMDLPLERVYLPYVREYEPGVVNGFHIGADGDWFYVNAREKLSTPIFYDPFRLTGVKKWEFRRTIYIRFLRARDCPPPRDPDYHRKLFAMSYRELMDEAVNVDPEMADLIARTIDGPTGDGRGVTWHGIPTIGYVR